MIRKKIIIEWDTEEEYQQLSKEIDKINKEEKEADHVKEAHDKLTENADDENAKRRDKAMSS